MILKTGDNVQWIQQKFRGEESVIEYGKIIGWYTQDAPIILLQKSDPEGNFSGVMYISALTKTDKEVTFDDVRG